MTEKTKDNRRSEVGYGSSYQKGDKKDLEQQKNIGSVLKGQVWKVKPDKEAKAANPCIWMQAGAVSFKGCNNYYDCTTCKYDLGMRKQVEKGKQVSWQDLMRRRADLGRICRHSLTHRIEKRECAYDYHCATCDFDQFFEDVWNTKTKAAPLEMHQIKGFDMPPDYYFHNGHTWARIESGGNIRIGIDDFALKVLGEADAFDLPLMGKTLEVDKAGWGLKRKENLADVLSPINGIITEVNGGIRENPRLANKRPYNEGWLFVVRTPDIKAAAKNLMVDADGFNWMNDEVDKLEKMIEDAAGPLAADGGYLTNDIFGNIPDLGWKNLTKAFLKT